MASRLFRRLSSDLKSLNNGQQTRLRHATRGKPPTIARTLEDRFEELNRKDPETSFRVDIGYKHVQDTRRELIGKWIEEMKLKRQDPTIEKKARNKELLVDFEQSKADWWNLSGPGQIRTIADHYEIFQHLFGDAYFTPVVPINIEYSIGEDLVAQVHRGNLMKPSETSEQPIVKYDAPADSLWTLLFTTPDGFGIRRSGELCHWFIGNIPGNDISKGDLLVDYLRPIPARGLGYGRYIFVLYRQEEKIDYSEYKREQPCLSLADRQWTTLDFYRKYQDVITPATLAFFQADWDSSLTEFYRSSLNIAEPKFEYDFPEPFIRKQKWFPKGQPFNLYLDKYRDPKDINKDFLMRKLKNVHPFRPPKPPLRYPNAHAMDLELPSWLRLEMRKERLRRGRVLEIESD